MEDREGLFSIADKFHIVSLDCAIEFAMGGIIPEQVDRIVDVNEGVIDDNNVHFARVKSSVGAQAPKMTKSVYSDLHHCVSGMWLALHEKMELSVEPGGAEEVY